MFNKYGEKAEEFEEAKFEFADAIESAILNVLKENKGLQVGDIVNITKLDAKVVADAIAKLAKAELVKSYEDGLETTPKGLEEIKPNEFIVPDVWENYAESVRNAKLLCVMSPRIIERTTDICVGFS